MKARKKRAGRRQKAVTERSPESGFDHIRREIRRKEIVRGWEAAFTKAGIRRKPTSTEQGKAGIDVNEFVPSPRTRKDLASIAVDAALKYLRHKLRRKPTTEEVYTYLADNIHSEGSPFHDAGIDGLIWTDTKNRTQKLTRDALRKRLQRTKNRTQ